MRQISSQVTCRFELKFHNISGAGPAKETNMTIVGLSVGAAVLVVVVVLALVLFMRQRKKRTQEKEKEMSDFNPVYATYEVHDDPVAEVKRQYFN